MSQFGLVERVNSFRKRSCYTSVEKLVMTVKSLLRFFNNFLKIHLLLKNTKKIVKVKKLRFSRCMKK